MMTDWTVWLSGGRLRKWWRLVYRGSEQIARDEFAKLSIGARPGSVQLRNGDGDPVETNGEGGRG
jgi:hypothetical protein